MSVVAQPTASESSFWMPEAKMARIFVFLLAIMTNAVTISLQASSWESDSYIAAVVEYAPFSGATLENKELIFMQNVGKYTCFMEAAARQNADIIVFPEFGLASMGVPRNPDGTPSLAFVVPAPGANPCNDSSSDIAKGLKDLSCAAMTHKLYTVVNLPEKAICNTSACPGFPASLDAETCPPSGAYFHNTNVVFDRSGTIVARYRKFNLYGEAGFEPTPQPEYAVFETDFGVRFATFICFDIMFERPATELARSHNVCDVVFTTAWFSESPFLTAVQTQAAWAYSLDMNMLASGYNQPEVGSAGSGIFLGRNGTLEAVMPNSTSSRLIVGSVPKMPRCKEALISSGPGRPVAEGEREDDDEEAEQTPLSAFHQIVLQRKYGHLQTDDDDGGDDDAVDELAPAFIHHSMYADKDEEDTDEEEFQPPSEPPSKSPPHFMGLTRSEDSDDEGDDENPEYMKEHKYSGEESDNIAETENDQQVDDMYGKTGENNALDIPENKVVYGSTSTAEREADFPAQGPDSLQLYVDEPEELPPDMLESEVLENAEREFQEDQAEEYFHLAEESEYPSANGEEEVGLEEINKEEPEEQPDIPDEPSDVDDEDEEKEQVSSTSDAMLADNTKVESMTGGEHNATEDEIEATLKNLDWLIDDTDDLLHHEDGNHVERTHSEEDVDTTDDVLLDHHGMHLLGDTESAGSDVAESQEQETKDPEMATDGMDKSETLRKYSQKCKKAKDLTNDKNGDQLSSEDEIGEQTMDVGAVEISAENQQVEPVTSTRRPCKSPSQKGENPEDHQPDYPMSDKNRDLRSSKDEIGEVTMDAGDGGGTAKKPCKPRPRGAVPCPTSRGGVVDDSAKTENTGIFLKTDNLDVYKTFTLNTETLFENSTVRLCDGTFCCDFNVVLEIRSSTKCPCREEQSRYSYRLAVFDGIRSFDGVATGGVQVCGVIPCAGDDLASCGLLILPDVAANSTAFRRIAISGVFSTNHTLVTANTLVPGLMPLPADKFSLASEPVDEELSRFTMQTVDSVNEDGISLFTFALHSRVYMRDGQEPTKVPEAAQNTQSVDDRTD